jgi:hypothetical protein
MKGMSQDLLRKKRDEQISLEAQHMEMDVIKANAVPVLYTGDRRRRISG